MRFILISLMKDNFYFFLLVVCLIISLTLVATGHWSWWVDCLFPSLTTDALAAGVLEVLPYCLDNSQSIICCIWQTVFSVMKYINTTITRCLHFLLPCHFSLIHITASFILDYFHMLYNIFISLSTHFI